SIVAATRSIASRARSGQLTLTFGISQLPRPRNWATPGGSNRYRAALVRRPLTPGPISSSPGTAGLPPFIFFRQATLICRDTGATIVRRLRQSGRDKRLRETGVERRPDRPGCRKRRGPLRPKETRQRPRLRLQVLRGSRAFRTRRGP